MVVIAGVVEDAGLEVVTVGINGDFVFVGAEVGAATLLVNGVKDVEELTDVGQFIIIGEGIELGEGDFSKARFGREVARETDGAHAAAVKREVDARSEGIDWGFGRKVLIITELEELLVKWRVVGEDANRVVVDFEAVFDGFDDDAFFAIVDDPVELGSGELIGEAEVAEVHFVEKRAGFSDSSALAENPREEFELSDVVFAVDVIIIDSVTDEVETGDTETFFVHAVVKKGIAVSDISDANDGVVGVKCAGFAEVEWEIAWNDDGFFAVRKFVVEVTTEVVISVVCIGGCGAHDLFVFL